MGKRGPQPIPTETLNRRGSWRGKTKERENEIKLPAIPEAPEPPSWISDEGRALWPDIAPRIHRYGLMRDVDAEVCALLCDAIVLYRRARDHQLSGMPVTFKDGQPKRNPMVGILREAEADVIRLMRELGMSPAARVGLTIDKPAAKDGVIVPVSKSRFAT